MSRRKLLHWITLPALLIISQLAVAQDRTVNGKVTDSKDGSPVVGASVVPKGTSRGTSTAVDGTFSITVNSSVTILVITSVGYDRIEVNISGKTTVEITLVLSSGNLNEVVVTGYGSSRKRDLTGSITSVKAKDFNRGVVTAPDQLIQGKVAGVQVINNSGQPGGGTTLRIRGTSSIRSGNNPLIVVDGVPLDGGSARPGVNLSNLGDSPSGNPLNFINPNDIASMDVLKDASAAAIYGSRGANGVILITTKKGQSGVPQIDFNVSFGVSKILKRIDVLTGDEYRAALTSYGITSGNFGTSVDALDEILRTAPTQNYNAAVSGGNDNGRYRISVGMLDQQGIVKESGFRKFSASISSSFKFLESKKLGLDINIIAHSINEKIVPISNNAGFQGSLIAQALQWNPTHALRKSDGSIWVTDPALGNTTINPLAMLEASDDRTNTTGVLASVSPSYKFTKDLEYRFLFSVNRQVGVRRSQVARWINLQNVENRGWANYNTAELTTQQYTHTLSYNKQITTNLNLASVIGFEYMKFDNKGLGISGQDFVDNGLAYTNFFQYASQNSRGVGSNAPPKSEIQSYFGRVDLNYRDKYLLRATLRADGSSKFGENNQYGYFPSFAAKWNVHNEDFFKGSRIINNLSLRLGWGQTGNQEFPAGASKNQFQFGAQSQQQFNIGNPDLKWETNTTINVGLDFAVWNSRIFGSVDFFNKETNDILFDLIVAAPNPPGSAKYWKNLAGTIDNTGFEVSLNGAVIKKADMTWNVGVNMTFLKNKLRSFNGAYFTGGLHGQGISGANSQRLITDQPLNVFYLRKFQGIDKATGQSIYQDDGYTLYYFGDPNPRTLVGISTDFSYKKWTVLVNMNGAYGHFLYNNTANSVLPIGNLGTRNITKSLIGGVKEDLSNPISPSTRYLEKGNYLKMSNATITYTFGRLGKAFRNVMVSLTAQNLFILTDFSGFDPEVNVDKSVGGIPSLGIEYVPYPSARTFSLGFSFGL